GDWQSVSRVGGCAELAKRSEGVGGLAKRSEGGRVGQALEVGGAQVGKALEVGGVQVWQSAREVGGCAELAIALEGRRVGKVLLFFS
ncbi:hypothetical protein CYMTET_15546, partial [Cymbomonas tetramitiformis]